MEYKEKLRLAKEALDSGSYDKDTIEYIFPELAESEEERIRKELLNAFKEATDSLYMVLTPSKREAFIAWLEKKGEQKSDSIDNKFIRMRETKPNDISDFLDRLTTVEQEFLWEHIAKIRELDKEEQKPADKVEPKFKVGDLIVRELDNTYYQIKKCILNVTTNKYGYDLTNGGYISSQDANFYHLWTIQDAKDGDILATLDYILIFKKLLPKDGGVSYCHYDFGCSTPHFNFNEDDNWYFGKEAKVYPATKEQRDLLFQKMKEAGYEWDAEKKELKNVEQKPWSEEVDLELVTDWFDHIAQIADDRMTLTGHRMSDSHALDEIKCIAKNSSEFITKHYKAQKGE